MKAWWQRARKRLLSTRGMYTAETVVTFFPVFTLFFIEVQYTHLATADLVLRHATLGGARAAVVILDPQHNPGGNGPPSDVINHVAMAMGPWLERDRFFNTQVTWEDTSSRANPHGEVTVKVVTWFDCRIPVGHIFVCGGRSMRLERTARLPMQGALYQM